MLLDSLNEAGKQVFRLLMGGVEYGLQLLHEYRGLFFLGVLFTVVLCYVVSFLR